MLNIVLLQSREGRRCLYLASGCGRTKLHLEEEEKRQHEQQDGLEIEEETIHLLSVVIRYNQVEKTKDSVG